MTCETMSDRMPLVASGESGWSEAERRHLLECQECSLEWMIVQAAVRVSCSAPALEPERIADRVLHRLSVEPHRARGARAWWIAGAGVTAAAAAVLAFALLRTPASRAPTPSPGFAIPMAELDSLTQEQLRLVLEAVEEPLETPMTNEAPSMLDLDDQQLERVLRSLEG